MPSKKISELDNVSSLLGTEEFAVTQGGATKAALISDISSYLITTGTWTPTLGGSGTAGTYELQTNQSLYYRIGDLVYLSVGIVLNSSITAGGTGNLQISNLPYNKIASHGPTGVVTYSGLDLSANVIELSVIFDTPNSASGNLILRETFDNAASSALPISAVAASDSIYASIVYLTS